MRSLVVGLIAGLALAACDRSPMGSDQEMMQGWVEELARDASQMRLHVHTMRQLPPEALHAWVDGHASLVTEMLDRMDGRMAEMRRTGGMGMSGMGMGMAMSDTQMGAAMGMNEEEHQGMLDLMQTLRSEVERLRTAPAAEVMERMPEHLDRLDAMVRMMEQSAARMRSMAEMGGM
jgi:adenylosuccinate synthase